MTIQEIKLYLKNNKITYQELSNMSGIALNTLKNIFRGKTEHPRIDTMQAIEHALELDKLETDFSEEERKLASLIAELTDDEVKELSSFLDYIISKRK